MGPNRRLATEEEEHCGTEGKDAREGGSHWEGDPKSGETGEQEEQYHAPGGNSGWHIHEIFSF